VSDSIAAYIVYLIAFPYIAPAAGRAGPPSLEKYKQAPYFLALDIEMAELGQSETQLGGRPITIRRQLIDEEVQSVECSYQLPDALSPASCDYKLGLHNELREKILAEASSTLTTGKRLCAANSTDSTPLPTPCAKISRSRGNAFSTSFRSPAGCYCWSAILYCLRLTYGALGSSIPL